MNRLLRVASASGLSIATAAALAACSSNTVVPQSSGAQPQSVVRSDQSAVPRFEPPHYQGPTAFLPSGAQMPTWNGSFKYNGNTYNYNMIGANPASSNTTTTIPVVIIPIKFEAGSKSFDPNKTKAPNGDTVTENVQKSPLFVSGIDFNQGGIDLGTTQYEDAFQRGNFWSSVQTNTGYHTLLGKPKVLKEVTVKGATLGNEFGIQVALYDYGNFDSLVHSLITKLKIPPGTLPIFLAYDTYWTSGGCCIGGWHDFTGTNTYSIASYVGTPGVFSQDVSALSHELGEWLDDPGIQGFNNVACGILEVGDPLEGTQNYGGYPYKLNNFTYNLQDLVWLPYFGAPKSTSANGWYSFQDYKFSQPCQNGG